MAKSVRRPRVDVLLQYPAHGHAKKTLIVLHQTISPDRKGLSDIQGVGGYLHQVDYGIHVITDLEGNSGAVAPEEETAIYWHVQGANTESIGIEQISYKTGVKNYWWHRAVQLNKTARWCAYLCKKHGIPPVYDPHAKHGICGHWDVTVSRGISGGHTDCQYPDYPTKWVAAAAKTYMKVGWA